MKERHPVLIEVPVGPMPQMSFKPRAQANA
jgi:hypothetical protein